MVVTQRSWQEATTRKKAKQSGCLFFFSLSPFYLPLFTPSFSSFLLCHLLSSNNTPISPCQLLKNAAKPTVTQCSFHKGYCNSAGQRFQLTNTFVTGGLCLAQSWHVGDVIYEGMSKLDVQAEKKMSGNNDGISTQVTTLHGAFHRLHCFFPPRAFFF